MKQGEKVMEKNYCCDMMEYFSTLHCIEHTNIFDCPDVLIDADKKSVILHDIEKSTVEIHFCPWCGQKLTQQ